MVPLPLPVPQNEYECTFSCSLPSKYDRSRLAAVRTNKSNHQLVVHGRVDIPSETKGALLSLIRRRVSGLSSRCQNILTNSTGALAATHLWAPRTTHFQTLHCSSSQHTRDLISRWKTTHVPVLGKARSSVSWRSPYVTAPHTSSSMGVWSVQDVGRGHDRDGHVQTDYCYGLVMAHHWAGIEGEVANILCTVMCTTVRGKERKWTYRYLFAESSEPHYRIQ